MLTQYVWRQSRVLFVAGLLSIPQLAAAASDAGTLLVGQVSFSCGGGGVGPPIQIVSGYAAGVTGSYSPTGLTGGKTVSAVYDLNALCVNAASSHLSVSGFTANPGAGWLTSITCNGVANGGTTAAFSYSAGKADWSWSTPFGLITKNGTNVGCTMVHS